MAQKRDQQIQKLKSEEFDVLVIGGGATGCGIALDAASRGMRIALIEAGDFSSGTSSRSTKLIHGGLRYLQKGIFHFDWKQLRLVKEGLRERSTILRLAPHLTKEQSILIPMYSWPTAVYYRIGLQLYDLLSGAQNLQPSRWLSAEKTVVKIPQINTKGLKGAIEFFDGLFDDARMNLTLALTAEQFGGCIANYVALNGFVKKNGYITHAIARDGITGDSWPISAKTFINAAGPFADRVRELDEAEASPLVQPSSGTHILLSKRLPLHDSGMIIPQTSDGRILFLLPWEGGTLVGTTDIAEAGPECIKPLDKEVRYLLDNIRDKLSVTVSKEDVLAAWKGIRPLVKQQNEANTSNLSREHIIEKRPSGLYSIIGGKWTSYRKMAEDMVDEIVQIPCRTKETLLLGASGFTKDLWKTLVETYGLEEDVAKHMANAYGDRSSTVLEIAMNDNLLKRISDRYPYIYAEVLYALRNEYACKAIDLLARRMRLAFLDVEETVKVLPSVVELMGKELKWSEERMQKEVAACRDELADNFGVHTETDLNRDQNLFNTPAECKSDNENVDVR